VRHPLAAPLFLVLLAVACAGRTSPETDPNLVHEVVVRTAGGDRSLSVRVADSDEERARGLMGVRDLPADDGMAFLFDGPSTGAFWMQNTLIPLSIAFVSEDGHILGITEMTPCQADPCPSYSAPGPYAWAVEANAGWFAANGARPGDEIVLLESA
jgi:uncharacterized membrane protein (UPF0127 family)